MINGIKVRLLRHGETEYNIERRYQGRLDISLSENGKVELIRNTEPENAGDAKTPGASRRDGVRKVYVTPLKRTSQTAEIIFPGAEQVAVPGLLEMDFGKFEGHTYEELKDDPDYRAFHQSGGWSDCPGGERRADFSARVCRAFRKLVTECIARGESEITIVTHGGPVMALMEHFGIPEGGYYEWLPGNGEGYELEVFLMDGDESRDIINGADEIPEADTSGFEARDKGESKDIPDDGGRDTGEAIDIPGFGEHDTGEARYVRENDGLSVRIVRRISYNKTAGRIHLYHGTGRGKSSTAAGTALRALHAGYEVTYFQLCKSAGSGETAELEKIGAKLIYGEEGQGFVSRMEDEAKKRLFERQSRLLKEIVQGYREHRPERKRMLVLDEVCAAVRHHVLDEEVLRELLIRKPSELEILMTGREPADWMIDAADYVTEYMQVRHPFTGGVSARKGIEF